MSDDQRVIMPGQEELALYGTEIKVCGDCKFFRRDEVAQEEIRKQRFYERLVREDGWKVKHLGSDMRTHGLCDAHHGELLTGAMHKSCDQFRQAPRGGVVRLRVKGRDDR